MKRFLCMLACIALVLTAGGCQQVVDVLDALTAEKSVANETLVESEWDADMDGLYAAPNAAMGGYNSASYAVPRGRMTVLPGDPWFTEEYAHETENGFISPRTSPLSTFAADVDTAAYANVRRLIRDQWPIDPDAVRIEEMLNAFRYDYAAPTGGAPLAIHTQVAPCPWNDKSLLLRVGLKAEDIAADDLPPANLVFLIDTSGSMDEPDKLPLAQRSFALLAEQLTARDRVSVVAYAGYAAVVLDGVRGDETATILGAIGDLSARGGTAGSEGIATAYALASRYAAPGVNSRVILATDGDFNIGPQSEAELIRLIEEQRAGGVFLTVLGFGTGNLKDNKMEALADHGNGNATYIDTVHQARRALVEEMGATLNVVAKDVKLQVEFNPATVEGYRLIGYENRLLAAEDFADDTKDGGEIGSGHCMTALYEIYPVGAGMMPEIPLTYQAAATTDSTDYATIHLRYKAPEGDTSTELVQAVPAEALTDAPDEDFRLAMSIAAFGQLLKDSAWKGSADQQMVLDLLQPLLSGDTGGRIVELSSLVRESGGLYGKAAQAR